MTVYYVCIALAGILTAVAAIADFRSFRIPNAVVLAVLLLFPAAVVASGHGQFPWSNLIHFAVALVVGMVFFALKWIGAGDAKFYAALALWFPFGQQAASLVGLTTLSGLVLAVIFILARKSLPKSDRERRIAYGIAIACGAFATFAIYGPQFGQDPMSKLRNGEMQLPM